MKSTHQVDMKNVVECPREFIAYFNALESRGVMGLIFTWSQFALMSKTLKLNTLYFLVMVLYNKNIGPYLQSCQERLWVVTG